MNILFSINAKFIGLTKTCIQSIVRFDKNIDFYILHQDLNQEHKDDLMRSFPDCTFHFIEVKEESFKDFPTSSRSIICIGFIARYVRSNSISRCGYCCDSKFKGIV